MTLQVHVGTLTLAGTEKAPFASDWDRQVHSCQPKASYVRKEEHLHRLDRAHSLSWGGAGGSRKRGSPLGGAPGLGFL